LAVLETIVDSAMTAVCAGGVRVVCREEDELEETARVK